MIGQVAAANGGTWSITGVSGKKGGFVELPAIPVSLIYSSLTFKTPDLVLSPRLSMARVFVKLLVDHPVIWGKKGIDYILLGDSEVITTGIKDNCRITISNTDFVGYPTYMS